MSQYIAELQSYLPDSEPFRSITTTAALGLAVFAIAKAVFAVKNVISFARRISAAKTRRANQKKNTVYLFGFPKTADGVQFSTPCERVEAYCQLKKIPFEYVGSHDFDLSDTGRFPMIELNGVQYTDSKFIIDHLETTLGKNSSEQNILDRQQESTLTALFALCDSIRLSHYRAVVVDFPNYAIDMYTKYVGYPRILVKRFVMSSRRDMIQMLNSVGHGDLSDAQYNKLFLEDLKALEYHCEVANKNNTFLLGTKKPSKGDCLIAPWIRNVRRPEALAGDVPAFAFACSSENFANYLKRYDDAINA